MKKVMAADLAVIRSESKLALALPAIYIIIGLWSEFFTVFCAIMAVSLVLNVMAYNERSGFDKGILILPVSRKTIVITRYMEAVVLSSAVLLAQFALGCLIPGGIGFQATLLIMGVLFLYIAFMFPLLIKLGVEKGRMVYLLCMIVAAMIGAAAFVDAPTVILGFLGAVVFLIGVIALLVSFRISVKFYEQREF